MIVLMKHDDLVNEIRGIERRIQNILEDDRFEWTCDEKMDELQEWLAELRQQLAWVTGSHKI